jgi:SAM-dependent methyltransferase
MQETDVAEFWQAHPCGDLGMGGLLETFQGDYESFFAAYDRSRYEREAHIPACLDELHVSGKRVLEIGLGQGADSEQLIRRGAMWTGVDVTQEAVDRVGARLALRNLPHAGLHCSSVTSIPESDSAFDLVFSHGVLHHVPDIQAAQREIHRVLDPNGRLIIMLYARWSLNYQVAIRIVRRAVLVAAWPVRRHLSGGLLREHLDNAEKEGLLNYLRMQRFVHANTDGPINPHARVYDLADVRRDFPLFDVVRTHKHYMHAPPLPVHGLPGGGLMGWHLWVELQPH